VQIGDNRAAEWVRRSNPVALGLLFSGLAGQYQIQNLANIGCNHRLNMVLDLQSLFWLHVT
jgi:hypothetical protein